MEVYFLEVISIIGFCLAGVSFVISAYLFFSSNINAVIGDLSGKTAQKQIEAIRKQNAESGDKRYRPSMLNTNRGKTTEKVLKTGKLKTNDKKGISKGLNRYGENDTNLQKLKNDKQIEEIKANQFIINDDITELLYEQNEPSLSSTEILTYYANEKQTCVHENFRDIYEGQMRYEFSIIEKILLIHTNETIYEKTI